MKRILLAGFGGQGILFAGKFLSYVGLDQGKEVSWLPSYGPEIRGGTANCSVILSEERIGSPIVSTPDILICMNLPSLDKFEASTAPGGLLLMDSTLIERKSKRTDITAIAIPATRLAMDNGMGQLANMIIIGRLLRETDLCDLDTTKRVLEKIIPEKKRTLLEANLTAINLGYSGKEG